MSTAQVRLFPIDILFKFIDSDIKVLSYQETHQLYLHKNNLNNYILPLDIFFVNSDFEKKNLTINDNNLSNIVVNKWPFFQNIKNSTIVNKSLNKQVLLILNPTNKYNSNTFENIKFQINLIKKIYRNLPKNCELNVKLHPVESRKTLINFFKNKNNIIFKNNDIIDLLSISDLVISSGYTQVIIESILCCKKTLIVSSQTNQYLLNDYKDIIKDFKMIPHYLNQKFVLQDHSFFCNKININNMKNIDYTFLQQFYETQNINIANNKFEHLTQLFLWSLFLENKNLVSKIFIGLKNSANTDQLKLIDKYRLIFESKILLNDFILLVTNTSNYKILIPMIQLFKIFIVNNNIFISDKILDIINKFNYPRYFDDLFFLHNQSFINYLLSGGNTKLATKLILEYESKYKNIIFSKSLKFRIYLKFRDFNAFYGFNLINKINFFIFNKFINIKK